MTGLHPKPIIRRWSTGLGIFKKLPRRVWCATRAENHWFSKYSPQVCGLSITWKAANSLASPQICWIKSLRLKPNSRTLASPPSRFGCMLNLQDHCSTSSILEICFSNFNMYNINVRKKSCNSGLGGAWDFAFLRSFFQVMLTLIHRGHFE